MTSDVVFWQQAYFGLINGAVYVLFAAGLNLLFGVMHVVNLAHGELAMLGGMLTVTFASLIGLPFAVSVLLSLAVVPVIGLVVSRVAIRPLMGASMLMPLLSTFGVSMILLHGAVRLWGPTPRQLEAAPFQTVFRPGGVAISAQSLMLLVVTTVVMFSLYILLTRTSLGWKIRAVQQNPMGARVIGLNIGGVYDATVMIASFLAAVAGIFSIAVVPYNPNMGQPLLLFGFAVVIVAGMGNVWGVIVAGLAIGILEALFGQYVSTFFRQAFIFSLMLLAMTLRPQGLFGRR